MTVPTGYKRTWLDYFALAMAIPGAWLALGAIIELITIANERQ